MNNKHNKDLSPEAERVMWEKGTEAPFSGKYVHHAEPGAYTCASCGATLFSSDAKFDTSTPGLIGWPSFDQAVPGSVKYQEDTSEGMHRTEVVCAKCKAHLGHVFDDAPDAKDGKHYCINSVCLDFKPKNETGAGNKES